MNAPVAETLLHVLADSGAVVAVFGLDGQLRDANDAFRHAAKHLREPADLFLAPPLDQILAAPDKCPKLITLASGGSEWSWRCQAVREEDHVVILAELDTVDTQEVLAALLRHNREIVDLQRQLQRETARRLQEEATRREVALRVKRLTDLDAWSRLKMELVRKMAHELRTPLTPLRIQLELLRRDLERSGIASKHFERVSRAAGRLTEVVTAMDNLIEREVAIATGTSERIELHTVARGVMEAMASEAKRGGHKLRGPEGEAWAVGEPAAVADILTVLIDNAMRYSKAGSEVRVECGHRRQAFVSVHDQGLGIRAEMKPRVFEPLAQIHDEMAVTDLGLGTSLATARLAARAMQGDLTVESPGVGEGSTFTLWLPAAA